MSQNSEVSIVIISHGQFELVKLLLSSLNQFDSTSISEIIIIENDHRGSTKFKSSAAPPIRYHINDNPRGYATNVNLGFSMASGRFFCTINPDVLLLQDTFATLITDILEGRGEIVAPAVVNDSGQLQDSARLLPTPWGIFLRRLFPALFLPSSIQDLPEPPEWIAGMLMMMRAKLFGELGGMDEGYFLYFEDVEFCTRARLAGHKLFVNRDLRIRHDARRRSRRELRYAAWHLASAYRFFRSGTYRKARRLKSA